MYFFQDSGADAIVPNYTIPTAPMPCDGPEVIVLDHYPGEDNHGEKNPKQCYQCGLNVAKLLHNLHIGKKGRTVFLAP